MILRVFTPKDRSGADGPQFDSGPTVLETVMTLGTPFLYAEERQSTQYSITGVDEKAEKLGYG